MDRAITVGTPVSARDYLRASVEGARATREYVAELERLPKLASSVALKAAAAQLGRRQAVASLASDRLSAMVVTDRRLEAQRVDFSRRFANVVGQMSAIDEASARGNRRDFVRARADLAAGIVQLRSSANQGP